jgi:hypothetical protein
MCKYASATISRKGEGSRDVHNLSAVYLHSCIWTAALDYCLPLFFTPTIKDERKMIEG